MSKKKTHEEFVEEMKEKHPDIEVLGQYINASTKIRCKCKIDGWKWEATPNHLLHDTGCPMCAGNARPTHEIFIEKLYAINPNIEVLDEYKNNHTKLLCRCLKDGYMWYNTPHHLLSGQGCPKCANYIVKTQERYENEVNKIFPNIEVLDNYVNDRTKIKHRCKIDGYEWYSSPSNILQGHGCPQCNESKGERKITNFLNCYNISTIPQKKFNDCQFVNPLPFDFYLPEQNILIEYQGEQHYKPVDYFGGEEKFKLQQKRDEIKLQYCIDNNIKLIRIPYWDFKNIEEILTKELSL